MMVTTDKYELPLVVADSVDELAKLLGVKPNSISWQLVYSKRHGTKSRYIRVEI